ncbi:MAG: Ig-like domain-containing protein [Lachnospiraceae bacterium]
MRTFKKTLAIVLATAMAATAVPASAAQSLTLSKKKATIYVKTTNGGSKTVKVLTAAKLKKIKNAGYTVSFKSSKPAVATVSKAGKVTAKKKGTATITVTYKKGKKVTKKTAKITVKKKKAAASDVVSSELAATQTGRKEFTVTGTGLTADGVAVTKGSTAVSATVTVNAEGTKAIVATAGNITEATYTITVGEKSVTVEGQLSTPTTVDIPSNYFVLNDKLYNYYNSTEEMTGKFTLVVRNQFGEDVTKQATPTVNVNGKTPTSMTTNTNGEGLVIESAAALIPQAVTLGTTTISVSVYDTTYPQLNTTKQLIVSDMATAKSITFTEIYNADGKSLVARADASDFLYLFDLVNSYDEKVLDLKDATLSNLTIYSNPGLTNLATSYTSNDIELVEKEDGTKSLGIRLADAGAEIAAGSGTITIMDATSGVSGSGNIEVGNGTVVDTFTATAPASVLVGQEAEFTYTALDAAGNPVTDLVSLKALLTKSNATGFTFRKEGADVKLYYDATAETKGQKYVYWTTENYKTSSTSYIVKAAARPSAIVGIQDAGTGILADIGQTEEYGVENFIFEDQYGNVMTDGAAAAALTANGYYVKAEADASSKVTVSNDIITTNSGKITVAQDGDKTGNTTITFSIVDVNGNAITNTNTTDMYDSIKANVTTNSQMDQKFVVAKQSSISSYSIDSADAVYTQGKDGAAPTPAYASEVKVYGKYTNVNIQVPAELYNITFDEVTTDKGTAGNTKAGIEYDQANQTLTGAVTGTWTNTAGSIITSADRVMTVNIDGAGSGLQVQKTIKLSTEAPAAKDAYFLNKLGNKINYITLAKDADLATAVKASVYVVDQYGVDTGDDEYVAGTSLVDLDAAKYTVSDINATDDNFTVVGNGTAAPTFKNVTAGDTATLKITFAGGYAKTVTLTFE